MKNFLILALITLSFQSPAWSFVQAIPGYMNFGTVTSGGTASTTIQFINMGTESIPFFNVNCNGDYSEFRCSSMCFALVAGGSCSVNVTFTPHYGDNMPHDLDIYGNGGTEFAIARISGIDGKK